MSRAADDGEALLLVDDRQENLVALRAILEPLGHRMVEARSGLEALRVLLSEEVSVILLDVRMPGMDGYETAEHIKRRERTSDIPIIFLTAEESESEQALRAFSAGAVDFVTKPFEPWALRAKVQVFVELAEKTRLLREQGDRLRRQLRSQYDKETEHLRRLADAAVAINSTQSLEEMLRVLNDSARAVIGAHEAETVITSDPELDWPARSRAYSQKYAAWAATAPNVHLAALYDIALEGRRPVRMTKLEIARSFAAQGVTDVASGHPLLEGWLAVPLIDRNGDALGLIQVADKVDGEFDDQDELVLLQLAQLASVAIENARRYAHEHEVAHTLQRSMLPRRLPDLPRAPMAARYRAGSAGTEVGGDWYDAVAIDDERILAIVGDVVGRGPSAAAVMGQLRTGWRAYALQHFPITVLMRSLDLLLQDLTDGMMATAVCILVDRARGEMEIVTAGHPPPLIVSRDGTAAYVRCDPHLPLGIQEAPLYTPTIVPVPDDAVMLLFTDGLVEDRDVSLDDGLRTLASVAAEASAGAADDVEELCDTILGKVLGSAHGDDVALLAVRFPR